MEESSEAGSRTWTIQDGGILGTGGGTWTIVTGVSGLKAGPCNVLKSAV